MLDLTTLSSSELVEMLMKDAKYYRELCKDEANHPERDIVKQHLETIINEIKSREGYKGVLDNEDFGANTPG